MPSSLVAAFGSVIGRAESRPLASCHGAQALSSAGALGYSHASFRNDALENAAARDALRGDDGGQALLSTTATDLPSPIRGRVGGVFVGELGGESLCGRSALLGLRAEKGAAAGSWGSPRSISPGVPPQGGAGSRSLRRTTVIWLILPVVICLSQRLSHACPSISKYKVKLRMAHYISYRLFDIAYPTWITVVILELIHAENPDFGRDVFIRIRTNALRGSLVNHDNSTDRMALRRRWLIQISSLSTFDGTVLAYRGCNG
jgi:hypothetical protein